MKSYQVLRSFFYKGRVRSIGQVVEPTDPKFPAEKLLSEGCIRVFVPRTKDTPEKTTGGKASQRTVSRWKHTPESLANKSLTDLNVLIAEIDASIDPFETREEAIAQLSKDL